MSIFFQLFTCQYIFEITALFKIQCTCCSITFGVPGLCHQVKPIPLAITSTLYHRHMKKLYSHRALLFPEGRLHGQCLISSSNSCLDTLTECNITTGRCECGNWSSEYQGRCISCIIYFYFISQIIPVIILHKILKRDISPFSYDFSHLTAEHQPKGNNSDYVL